MKLIDQLHRLKDKPTSYLTESCVLSLGAFFFGYKMANAGISTALEKAATRYQTSAEGSVCTRAFLLSATSEAALYSVLDAMIEIVGAESEQSTDVRGPVCDTHIVEFVHDALSSGRTGTVLLEPTMSWFANLVEGHTAGLWSVNPDLARSQTNSLKVFERWLQTRYEEPAASWYAVLRVYGGADIYGLKHFVEMWDEARILSQ